MGQGWAWFAIGDRIIIISTIGGMGGSSGTAMLARMALPGRGK